MVTLKLIWLILVICILTVIGEEPKKPIVQTKGGKVQGKTSKCGLTCRYFSFLGIPYAQPPVGPLRFKNPVPHQGWEDVRDGSKHGNVCLYENIPLGLVGDEDCLFVNVFTQNVTGNLPVIVWIHGGGFWFGSGNSFIYGLDNFVTQGLVAVSINYRLGALGFFSTGDEHAQGNWAMKDQVLALKWVQENIAAFGGNPNDVTIFGESAGGSSVNYLMLSEMANGLFHKAISNSGTTLVPWTFQNDPRNVADYLADYFKLPKESKTLVEGLRRVNASDFIAAQPNYFKIEVPRGMRPFYFVPNAEPTNSPEPTFLTKSPYETIKSGRFSNVPYLVGYNSRESLFLIRELGLDKELFDKFNSNPHFLVPFAWNIKEGTKESEAVYSAFQTYYWGGGNLTDNMKQEWINYLSDHHMIYFVDKTVEMMNAASTAPIYYYQFSYDGDLNFIKRFLLLKNYEGVPHGEDIFHLFEVSNSPTLPVSPTSHARTVKKRMIKLWSNFAKFGEPTPFYDTLLQNVRWKAVSGTQEFLDIGHDLVPGRYPNKERMALWKHLEQLYGNDIFNN